MTPEALANWEDELEKAQLEQLIRRKGLKAAGLKKLDKFLGRPLSIGSPRASMHSLMEDEDGATRKPLRRGTVSFMEEVLTKKPVTHFLKESMLDGTFGADGPDSPTGVASPMKSLRGEEGMHCTAGDGANDGEDDSSSLARDGIRSCTYHGYDYKTGGIMPSAHASTAYFTILLPRPRPALSPSEALVAAQGHQAGRGADYEAAMARVRAKGQAAVPDALKEGPFPGVPWSDTGEKCIVFWQATTELSADTELSRVYESQLRRCAIDVQGRSLAQYKKVRPVTEVKKGETSFKVRFSDEFWPFAVE